jgi:hypothetical protein
LQTTAGPISPTSFVHGDYTGTFFSGVFGPVGILSMDSSSFYIFISTNLSVWFKVPLKHSSRHKIPEFSKSSILNLRPLHRVHTAETRTMSVSCSERYVNMPCGLVYSAFQAQRYVLHSTCCPYTAPNISRRQHTVTWHLKAGKMEPEEISRCLVTA